MSKPVTLQNPILALFRDKEDERLGAILMNDIPGIVSLSGVAEIYQLQLHSGIIGTPRLVIISSRLYPARCPELVQEMKELYPDAEFLLLTPANDPLPQFQQLARDKIRHLTVTPLGEAQDGTASLREVVVKLLAKHSWNITDYVTPGTHVHGFPISYSWQKEALITAIEDEIAGDSSELDLLRQKAALLADEMLENALYGAPQGEDGSKIYHKGTDRVIQENEGIHFCYAFDGRNLAMEITDGWGTLSADQLVSYLANNQDSTDLPDDDIGGRGLFIIWRFMDHLHVTIRPGQQTVLGGHLKAYSLLDPEAPKGFSIATHFN